MSEPQEYRQHRFTPPPGAVDLLLVRHGESAAAVDGESFPLVDGQGDPPLHPAGVEQAQRVGERLRHERIDAIYVTTLQRTAQTAAPLAAALGLTPTVEPDLREVHLGEWEGGAFRKYAAEGHPAMLQMAVEERWDVIPGAEAADAFASRVRGAIQRLAAAHPDQTVAVFTHGGVIGEVLAQAARTTGFTFTGADNASISQIVVTGDRWVIRRFNDTSHLSEAFTLAPEPLT
jgi:probable phosphoglycerate mutase